MKPKERIQHYQHFWAIGLAVALVLLCQFLTAGAQTVKSKITTTGADATFESVLAQPVQFLQSLGFTPEQVQKQLKPRPRITVVGGSMRNLGLAAFANLKNAKPVKSSIKVVGAGSVRAIKLVAPAVP